MIGRCFVNHNKSISELCAHSCRYRREKAPVSFFYYKVQQALYTNVSLPLTWILIIFNMYSKSQTHKTLSDEQATLVSLRYRIYNAIGWFFSGFQHLSTVLAENAGLEGLPDISSATEVSRSLSTDNNFVLEASPRSADPHAGTISSGPDGGKTPGKRISCLRDPLLTKSSASTSYA
jgi:hypothetical protein